LNERWWPIIFCIKKKKERKIYIDILSIVFSFITQKRKRFSWLHAHICSLLHIIRQRIEFACLIESCIFARWRIMTIFCFYACLLHSWWDQKKKKNIFINCCFAILLINRPYQFFSWLRRIKEKSHTHIQGWLQSLISNWNCICSTIEKKFDNCALSLSHSVFFLLFLLLIIAIIQEDHLRFSNVDYCYYYYW
jgi:hypothetical protein